MDSFSLLKYWRGSGGANHGATADGGGGANVRTLTSRSTSLVTALSHAAEETDDDGPFFDFEFAVADDDDGDEESKAEVEQRDEEEADSDEPEVESEFRFKLSSGSSADQIDLNAAVSPSDDLFFKGSLFPVETSSIVLNGSDLNTKNQFSLLKSATKLGVMMLKLKKSRAEKTEFDGSASPAAKTEETQQQRQQKKLFTVKLKVEDVPIVSLFIRDNSSRSHSGQKHRSSDESAADEKKLAKDVMQRYLNMVKPLYVRGSRRYGQKSKSSGQSNLGKTEPGTPPPSTAEQKSVISPPLTTSSPLPQPSCNVKGYQKQGNLTAGFREVCKHLGKSRSASAAAAETSTGSTQTRRRDDSLLQQQDGIQSAILHCKRSFNEPRDR